FNVKSANNTTDGPNGLPVVGGARAVNLTIAGNADTIQRYGSKVLRFFDVAAGSALTLDHVTLQGGWVNGSGSAADGGAIYNRGSLTVSNGSTLWGNSASDGAGIYNAGGVVTVGNSTLYGLSNAGGTSTITSSTLY